MCGLVRITKAWGRESLAVPECMLRIAKALMGCFVPFGSDNVESTHVCSENAFQEGRPQQDCLHLRQAHREICREEWLRVQIVLKLHIGNLRAGRTQEMSDVSSRPASVLILQGLALPMSTNAVVDGCGKLIKTKERPANIDPTPVFCDKCKWPAYLSI